jgi:transcriptional regulator with XRE-family HTH domain
MTLCNENLEICSEYFTPQEVERPETDALIDQLKEWVSQERGRQSQIARMLNVSRATVTEWLKGRSVPSWESGKKIEQFLKKQRKAPRREEKAGDERKEQPT